MNSRQESILDAIIREFVETAEPVGSLCLVEKYQFPFSPATIRAEMAELERLGYIYQPHTSAGRVPTEAGYRYFVNLILEETKHSKLEKKHSHKVLGKELTYERLVDLAAKTLAESTGNVGIVGISGLIYSHGIANLYNQPEFLEHANVVRTAETLDRMHELMEEMPKVRNPLVFIGSEGPFGHSSGSSLVVVGFETPYNTLGRIAVLGPTRMSYPRVIAVVEEVREMLESWQHQYK
jgi:transcriptional regulator of heat shock response